MINFLDLIFPKRCVQCKKSGDYLCSDCFAFLSFDTKNLCLVCQRPVPDNFTHKICLKRYAIDGCFSAVPYNKTVKKLIYNFKYKPYLSDLKKFLSDLMFESLSQNESFNKILKSSDSWVLIPISLHSSRFRKRGYNHSEILAYELGKKLKIQVQTPLKRIKDTKSQYGLKLPQRKKNIKGAFGINSSFIINHSSLKTLSAFLVDDIVTTGSTLLEAANILKRNGANKVYGLTLARD